MSVFEPDAAGRMPLPTTPVAMVSIALKAHSLLRTASRAGAQNVDLIACRRFRASAGRVPRFEAFAVAARVVTPYLAERLGC